MCVLVCERGIAVRRCGVAWPLCEIDLRGGRFRKVHWAKAVLERGGKGRELDQLTNVCAKIRSSLYFDMQLIVHFAYDFCGVVER
jgi:hypothetical protein